MYMMGHSLRLVSWGTTNECNLSCIYCYRAAGNKLKNELSTTEAIKLLESIKLLGGKAIVLSGGEPLLRQDIFEIIRYGSKIGLRVLLATGGTLIDRTMAIKLKKAGVSCVSIGIDGANPDTHDKIRGVKGAYKLAIKGVMECINVGLDLQINVTVTKLNYREIPKIIELADKIGAKYMHIFSFIPTGRGENIEDLTPTQKQYHDLLTYILKTQPKYKGLIIKPTCSPQYWVYLSTQKPSFAQEFLKLYPRGCVAGISYLYISPQGDVFPCPYLQISVGNIRIQPLHEIWLSSPILQKLRNIEYLKGRCKTCSYNSVCSGCRARAYVYRGDFLSEDPLCTLK